MFSRDDPAEDYYGGWAAEQREWRAILQHSVHCPRAAGGQPAPQLTIHGVANAFFAKKTRVSDDPGIDLALQFIQGVL